MKKILIIISILLMSFTYVRAENRIYYDTKSGLEIVDISGKKDIEQLKKDFNSPDLMDVTQERLVKQAEDRATTEEKAKVEKLIQEKMREQAISELKKEGKLDKDGKIK